MSINYRLNNRGDTLIEVLFAFAVFSLIAVGAMSIMNEGTATAQRALEISLVRNEIDAQAETLRFLNASYIAAFQSGGGATYLGPSAQWSSIQTNTVASTSSLDNCTPPDKSFVVNTRTAEFVDPTGVGYPQSAKTFSQVVYNGDAVKSVEGIWIEAISPSSVASGSQSNAGYIDFHIRACWDSPGQSTPMTLGTIVRLYEPRG